MKTLDIDVLDNLPSAEKMSHRDVWRHKGNNYPFRKIYRFFLSNVGNLWDDVYSKYHKLEWLPVQYKTMEYASREVILNTYMKNGKVYYVDKYCIYGYSDRCIDEYRWGHGEVLYVHPETKILCYKKHTPRKKEKKEITIKILGDYHQLLKLNGIWYEIKAKPVISDIIEINGLYYRKVKYNPADEVDNNIHFGGKIIPNKYYKKINGEYYIPAVSYEVSHYKSNKVGPKDRLIEDDDNKKKMYYQKLDYSSVKLTYIKQISHKELKHHKLSNDKPKLFFGKKCSICGGFGNNCIHNIMKKA